jgi:hypothetical protein
MWLPLLQRSLLHQLAEGCSLVAASFISRSYAMDCAAAPQGDESWRRGTPFRLFRAVVPHGNTSRAGGDRLGTSGAHEMNWRRGMLRLWLVLSVMWSVGFSIAIMWAGLNWGAPHRDEWVGIALVGCCPWIITVLGFAIRWTASGFRPRPSNRTLRGRGPS